MCIRDRRQSAICQTLSRDQDFPSCLYGTSFSCCVDEGRTGSGHVHGADGPCDPIVRVLDGEMQGPSPDGVTRVPQDPSQLRRFLEFGTIVRELVKSEKRCENHHASVRPIGVPRRLPNAPPLAPVHTIAESASFMSTSATRARRGPSARIALKASPRTWMTSA